MSLWIMLAAVIGAGAVGGVVNAIISDNGFPLPRTEVVDRVRIVRPGYLGNVVTGAIAAGISWGLYGPAADLAILRMGTPPAAAEVASLSLSALVGAALVGIGGARWLSNEVDKRLLKAAAGEAAQAKQSPDATRAMMAASPAQALEIAKSMPD